MTLLKLLVAISLRKTKEDELNERGDFGVPFYSLNNNTRTGLVICLCLNANPLISLIPPNGLKF